MGFRTVLILDNDMLSDWSNDPLLGRKIAMASDFGDNHLSRFNPRANVGGYGQVIENCHADCQTLMVIDSFSGNRIAFSGFDREESTLERNIKLLKAAADSLGYRLVKKAKVTK